MGMSGLGAMGGGMARSWERPRSPPGGSGGATSMGVLTSVSSSSSSVTMNPDGKMPTVSLWEGTEATGRAHATCVRHG